MPTKLLPNGTHNRCARAAALALLLIAPGALAQPTPAGGAEPVLRIAGHEAVVDVPLQPAPFAECFARAAQRWGAQDAAEAEAFLRESEGVAEVACFVLPAGVPAATVVAQLPGGMVGGEREDALLAVWFPPLLRGVSARLAVLRDPTGDVMLAGATPAPSAEMLELLEYLDQVFTVALDRTFAMGVDGLPNDCRLGYEAGGVRVAATPPVPLASCRVHALEGGESVMSVWIEVATAAGERFQYP
jgi:hypothetical protein